MGLAEDVGALGHEVDAAENDVAGARGGSLLGELEGIAAEISELNDFIALVVMAQNDGILAEARLGSGDAGVEGRIGRQEVVIEIAGHALFDFRDANTLRLRRFRPLPFRRDSHQGFHKR